MGRLGSTKAKPNRSRADGRRSLLVYLDPKVIKQLKKTALDHERPAYEITEEAVREWLASHRAGPKGT
jgi:hypothetical protein